MTEGNVNVARLVSIACYNHLKITALTSFVTSGRDKMPPWATVVAPKMTPSLTSSQTTTTPTRTTSRRRCSRWPSANGTRKSSRSRRFKNRPTRKGRKRYRLFDHEVWGNLPMEGIGLRLFGVLPHLGEWNDVVACIIKLLWSKMTIISDATIWSITCNHNWWH